MLISPRVNHSNLSVIACRDLDVDGNTRAEGDGLIGFDWNPVSALL